MKEINGQIDEIGLKYIEHFNTYQFEVSIKTHSNYFSLIIPLDRFDQFIKLFPEINWEDGYMLHKLKGRYLRCCVVEDPKSMTNYTVPQSIVALKHIVREIIYLVEEGTDESI